MGTIFSVRDNIKKLDLAKEGMFTVVEFKDEILALNKEQMLEGVNKQGTDIKPEYSPSTLSSKKKLGRSGKVDLWDKGDFHSSMELKVVSKLSYIIDSSDWKNARLVKKYGSSIPFFGLNPTSREELIRGGFESSLIQRCRNVMGL